MMIKVGFLAAYDYALLEYAIPPIYASADEITICIDRDRLTWTGEPFVIEPSFFDWLKGMDRDGKVRLYEDTFYDRDKQAMDNDTHQRNQLARYMGEGGWHVQLDADEYFVDFPRFAERLKLLDTSDDTTVLCRWLSLYKRVNGGFLYVGEFGETVPIGTNHPRYEMCRWNKANAEVLFEDCFVVHQSWARTEEEMHRKLANWSHANDFDHESYFELWKAVDHNNYRYMNSFHPLVPALWGCLKFTPADSIESLMSRVPAIIRQLQSEASQKAEESSRAATTSTKLRRFFTK